RAGDQLGFPGAVGVMPPMLQGAAAADLEMRAGWRLAIARRRRDLEEFGRHALAAPLSGLGLDGLARQGEGHEITLAALLGDSVAGHGDVQDVELDAHIGPSSRPRSEATSGATVLLSGGARLPLSLIPDHSVECDDELAHASHEANLSWLASQTLGKSLDGR